MLFDVLIFWRTLWLRLQKCFALLGWLMSWWVKLQTLETSVFQWHLETESKWLRSKRYNQKYFCLFLCRSCQVHWRKGLKKYFKKNWLSVLTKMGCGFTEMVLQEKRNVQWDNTFNYNRFSCALRRMAKEGIKDLLISLDFSTQVLFLWMSLLWVTCCLCFSFPLFQSCLCLKSKR